VKNKFDGGIFNGSSTIGGGLSEGVSSICKANIGWRIYIRRVVLDLTYPRDKSENSIGGYDFWLVKTDSLVEIFYGKTR
jgi:hypothetical protein